MHFIFWRKVFDLFALTRIDDRSFPIKPPDSWRIFSSAGAYFLWECWACASAGCWIILGTSGRSESGGMKYGDRQKLKTKSFVVVRRAKDRTIKKVVELNIRWEIIPFGLLNSPRLLALLILSLVAEFIVDLWLFPDAFQSLSFPRVLRGWTAIDGFAVEKMSRSLSETFVCGETQKLCHDWRSFRCNSHVFADSRNFRDAFSVARHFTLLLSNHSFPTTRQAC